MFKMEKYILERVNPPQADSLLHTLPLLEQVQSNLEPLKRLHCMDEDTYEELISIWAYSCLNKYQQVYRIGGAGDKGRDVIAYLDCSQNIFDLYQCKYYDHSLSYSDLRGEIGKLITYTFKKDFPIPNKYYIMCPNGVSQSFWDLKNNTRQFADLIISDWDEIKAKVGKKHSINISEELKAYIQNFDFSIITFKDENTFIEEFRHSPYYFYYFGGGFNLIKRVRITVPCNLQEYESNYIKHLLEAYSENLGHQVTEINITGKYEKHLSLSRSNFYSAEEVRLASRQACPPDIDEFERLKDNIEQHVGIDMLEEYKDGYEKVNYITNLAKNYDAETSLIKNILDSNSKAGVCHHLANEDRLIWKTKN